jgi:hypothetical protein
MPTELENEKAMDMVVWCRWRKWQPPVPQRRRSGVIRRGRPARSHSSGQGSDGSSAASHGGVKPGSLGANLTLNGRQRAGSRRAVAAAAAVIRGDERPGSSLEVAPRRRSHAGTCNGPQLLARELKPEFALRQQAVASRRCFQRDAFVDGPAMSKVQWLCYVLYYALIRRG